MKWKVPVTWEMCGVVEIEAPTLADAMEHATMDESINLPGDSSYVDGSFGLSTDDEDIIRQCHNEGRPDEEVGS